MQLCSEFQTQNQLVGVLLRYAWAAAMMPGEALASLLQAWHKAGASLILGVQSERFEDRVTRMAQEAGMNAQVLCCDVADDTSVQRAAESVGSAPVHALVHSVAFAPAAAMKSPFSHTSRSDFATAMDISVYSLIALTAAFLPHLKRCDGHASVQALTYIGSTRVSDAPQWAAAATLFDPYTCTHTCPLHRLCLTTQSWAHARQHWRPVCGSWLPSLVPTVSQPTALVLGP